MKRFSVLVLLIAIIISAINLFSKPTHSEEVKETEYDSQETERDGNCVAVTDDVKLVSDTNTSDERDRLGTDNRTNLKELYYKDGYIYFKYSIIEGDIRVGGTKYKQDDTVTFDIGLSENTVDMIPLKEFAGEGVGYHQTVTVSTKETKDDFGRVYIGELTDEDFAKYKSILARATTTYTDEHWAGTGLTLTRSVDYRNPLYKNID